PMVAAAETEGNKRAARSLRYAMEVERVHYDLYGKALAAVKTGADIADAPLRICPNCGHTVIGDAPESCPVCGAAAEHYLIIA
ncbi:rubrerythrin family protein, partial [Mycobacterium tuberculosis]|nr:rubrerythrin family protein [Mycobacterium tuberculosis]